MNPASAQQLWAKLASAGLTVGNMPEAEETDTPWYVRVMLGIAGFIAAVFLLGFVGVGFAFVLESKAACLAALATFAGSGMPSPATVLILLTGHYPRLLAC